ncbi:MAG: VOC family protein [Acidiferrobacteraceae bacterium]
MTQTPSSDTPRRRSLMPHLVCGDAAHAIDFYCAAFGAEVMDRLAASDGRIVHAGLRIGDSILMLTGENPAMGNVSPLRLGGSPVTLHLQVANVDAAMTRAAQAGATVTMPATDMFWGDRYGQLQDPFGHRWSVATHLRDVSAEEMAAAVKALC